jgi:hypothetical protein
MHHRTGVDAMNTMTLLMVLSLVGAIALFAALGAFLWSIVHTLEEIGGAEIKTYGARSSFLSKIRLGVRAIEVQTGNLAPQVVQLNGGLTAVRDGLGAIDSNLAGVITNVLAQEKK